MHGSASSITVEIKNKNPILKYFKIGFFVNCLSVVRCTVVRLYDNRSFITNVLLHRMHQPQLPLQLHSLLGEGE